MDLTVRDQSSNLEQFLVLLYILDPTIWNCFRLLCPSPTFFYFPYVSASEFVPTKGQLISKCLFGVIILTKKTTEYFQDFCLAGL